MLINAMLTLILWSHCAYWINGTERNSKSSFSVHLQELNKEEAIFKGNALNVNHTTSVITKDVIRMELHNMDYKEWVFPNFSLTSLPNEKPTISKQIFQYFPQPYSFIIDGCFVFSKPVIIGKYHSSFTLQVNRSRVFGFGEQVGPLFLGESKNPGIYTFFNKDQQSPISKGEAGKNIYGTHPFGVFYDPVAQRYSAIFYRTSNAFDLTVTHTKESTTLEFISTGSYIELYFFRRSKTLDNIVKDYHALIGRPYLPSYWTLGYHSCNWGWHSTSELYALVEEYDKNEIPVDAVWGDIDYMDDYEDFTVHSFRYGDLLNFTNYIHKKDMKYVPITDAGIKTKKDSMFTLRGYEDDCFIKSAATGRPLEGKVWPGNANFLDWFNPNSTKLWHYGLSELKKKVDFDGIWLDMNEVASFCDGECPGYFGAEIPYTPKNSPYFMQSNHAANEFSYLKFPGVKQLHMFTISMEGYHYSTNELEDNELKEWNTHNLFGLMSAKATSEYFINNNKRPFVLTRSSFPSTGQFASKWLGDNFATQEYLNYSINGLITFSLFGMPEVGADMCGFMGNANQSLCLAWYMLGAFYPFTRTHHDSNGNNPFNPIYRMPPSAVIIIKYALRAKYSISQYYYTTLANIHISGGTLINALFYKFPTDPLTFDYSEKSFMISDGILIYGKLTSDEQVEVYLPNYNWYDFHTFNVAKRYVEPTNATTTQILGTILKYPVSISLPMYIMGGNIIPYQSTDDGVVTRLLHMRNRSIELIIALDHNNEAKGSYFIDDGDEYNSIENGHYRMYEFEYANSMLSVRVVKNSSIELQKLDYISEIYLLGYSHNNTGQAHDNSACIKMVDGESTIVPLMYDGDGLYGELLVTNIAIYNISRIIFGAGCI